MVLTNERGYESSSEEGNFPPDPVDYSESPLPRSPTRSKPNAKNDQRDAPTEVVTEAQAETSSQAWTVNRPSYPGTLTRRPTPAVTQARTEVTVVDSDNFGRGTPC